MVYSDHNSIPKVSAIEYRVAWIRFIRKIVYGYSYTDDLATYIQFLAFIQFQFSIAIHWNTLYTIYIYIIFKKPTTSLFRKYCILFVWYRQWVLRQNTYLQITVTVSNTTALKSKERILGETQNINFKYVWPSNVFKANGSMLVEHTKTIKH